jgi:hypothetical protein
MLKHYPEQYIEPTVKVIDTLSLTGKPNIVGSASDRTILYSADLDMNEEVSWSSGIPHKFKNIVESLEEMRDVRVTDIKAGIVPCWNVMEEAHLTKGVVLGYNYQKYLDQLEKLYDEKIITKDEYQEAKPLIKEHPSPLEFLVAKKALRFGLVRWTPKDIESGFVKLRDGTTLDLATALQQPSTVKIDVVVWIENRFVDVEALYFIRKNGRLLVETTPEEIKQGIKESLLVLAHEQNWMKVAKRLYSLAKRDKATTILDNLREKVFNTQLGILYSVLSDAKSLDDLREEGITDKEKERIRQETDGFRSRLALITLPPLLKPVDPFSKGFIAKMEGVLQPRVKEVLTSMRLLPIPKKWLP